MRERYLDHARRVSPHTHNAGRMTVKLLDDLKEAWADLTSLTAEGLYQLTHEDLDALKQDFQDATDAAFDFLKRIGVMGAAPEVGAGWRPFRRLLVARVKRRALEQAIADGETEEAFYAAWARAADAGSLTDASVYAVAIATAPEVGAIGDGRILDAIKRIVDWLADPANREKILAIVKWVMSLLAMFGL